MWERILKSEILPVWLQILVDYDLPLQIARELNKYNNATKTENQNLSTKLQRIDQYTNRGAEIGRISRKIRKMVESTDIKTDYGRSTTRREDFRQMTPEEYEYMFKYTRHLVEQL